MMNTSMVEHFDAHFEVVPVRDAATRREVFRLRFSVYCEELAYEDVDAFPDGEEHDAFDEDSGFALLRHRATGRAAGCVRLIVTTHNPELHFPFEGVCAGRLDPEFNDPESFDRTQVGEISRLAIHQDFRRRKGESHTPEGASEPKSHVDGNRRYPLIAMGLFLSAAALAMNSGLEQVVVMMEPRLARLLAACGIRFTPVGEVIDHHGRRGPYQICPADLHQTLPPDSLELLRTLIRTLN